MFFPGSPLFCKFVSYTITPPVTDIDRQMKLEAVQDGPLRYAQSREYQLATDSKPVHDLIGHSLKPLADAILAEQLDLKTRQKLPSDIDVLHRVLREEFVRIYSEPVLQNSLDEQRAAHPDVDLPDVPQTGNLDLRQVLPSPYFLPDLTPMKSAAKGFPAPEACAEGTEGQTCSPLIALITGPIISCCTFRTGLHRLK